MRVPAETAHEWSQRPNRLWISEGIDPTSGADLFTSLGLRALRGFEEGRWHISVSRSNRYPSWDELADARYDLGPLDIEMAMILPPPSDYVNLHPYVFHLWQVMNETPFLEEDLPFKMSRSRQSEIDKGTTEGET